MLYDVLNTVAARSTLERWIHVKAFIPDWYHLLNLYHTQRRRWGKLTSWGGIFFFFLRQLRSGFFQKGLQLSADLVQSDLLKISWHDPRGERWLIVTPPPPFWWSTGVNQAINAIVEELLFPPAITENDIMPWGRRPLSCFHASVSRCNCCSSFHSSLFLILPFSLPITLSLTGFISSSRPPCLWLSLLRWPS